MGVQIGKVVAEVVETGVAEFGSNAFDEHRLHHLSHRLVYLLEEVGEDCPD